MIGKEKIRDLINLVEESNINEIVISSFWGLKRIRISKSSAETVSMPKTNQVLTISPEPHPAQGSNAKADGEGSLAANQVEIKAPLVGTFYSAAKPGEPAFVKLGDTVNEGQTVCIIEAMKIFNEIDAEFSGKVVRILVQNEEPVEFDQTLMILETS